MHWGEVEKRVKSRQCVPPNCIKIYRVCKMCVVLVMSSFVQEMVTKYQVLFACEKNATFVRSAKM